MEDTKKISSMKKGKQHEADTIMDKAKNAKESGRETMVHLKEKANAMKENVNGYIKKNPEKSVAIAAGVGIATGAILTAAMRRKKRHVTR